MNGADNRDMFEMEKMYLARIEALKRDRDEWKRAFDDVVRQTGYATVMELENA